MQVLLRERTMTRFTSRGKVLDWRDTLQIGDVIKTKTGYRVVRDVNYFPDDDKYGRGGLLHLVCFAIKRRSWTQRAYTYYDRTALKGWQKVDGVRVKLNTDADKKLLDDIREFKAAKNHDVHLMRTPFLPSVRPATDKVDNYDYIDAKMFP